jgi:hypothetical protein
LIAASTLAMTLGVAALSLGIPRAHAWTILLGLGALAANTGLALLILADSERFLTLRLSRAAKIGAADPETGLPNRVGLLAHLGAVKGPKARSKTGHDLFGGRRRCAGGPPGRRRGTCRRR